MYPLTLLYIQCHNSDIHSDMIIIIIINDYILTIWVMHIRTNTHSVIFTMRMSHDENVIDQ